jgi:hypothetical protein
MIRQQEKKADSLNLLIDMKRLDQNILFGPKVLHIK